MKYSDVRKSFIISASKKNIPIAGEFELTPYCNLKCKMCYMREDTKQNILSASEWIDIIKQAKEAGLLFCLFTGGEIFARGDFDLIYKSTYDMGIRIVLYTNGTLINNDIIKMLVERPPDCVTITLYGSNSKTYERITGSKEGFNHVINAINLLKLNNIKTQVRTIPIKEIYDEIHDMIKLIKNLKVPVSYSLYVGPRRDKDHLQIKSFNRLTPTEVNDYQKIFEEEFGSNSYTEYKNSDNGFNCVAGKSAYFINWKTEMTPCAMLEYPNILLDRNDFFKTWTLFNELINKTPNCSDCISCRYKNNCIQCPAKRYLENGIENCSDYLREIAKLRFEESNDKVQNC